MSEKNEIIDEMKAKEKSEKEEKEAALAKAVFEQIDFLNKQLEDFNSNNSNNSKSVSGFIRDARDDSHQDSLLNNLGLQQRMDNMKGSSDSNVNIDDKNGVSSVDFEELLLVSYPFIFK